MKVLVTGANGFLASNIIRELLARGITVRGMLRENCNEKSLQGVRIELVRGNIVSYPDVLKAAKGCDVVIHTAADTSQYYSHLLPLYPVNVNGTANVINAVNSLEIRRMIFVSTANTIGMNPLSVRKPDDLSALYLKSGYALSKLEAEELIFNVTKTGRLNAIVVNPTFMIGAYDAKPSSGRIFLQFLRHRIVVYPTGGKNFIDVKCAAKAICNAIEMGQNGRKYILAGENLTFKEFSDLLNEYRTKKAIHIKIPDAVLLILGICGSLMRLAGFKTELNYYNARILTKSESICGEEAEKGLNLPKTDVSAAINEAVTWFSENDYLG